MSHASFTPAARGLLARAVGALALGAAAVAPTRTAAQAGGATFTYRVQSSAAARAADGRRAGSAPSPDMLATVRMAGGNVRIDFREGGLPMTQNGGYLLLRGAEQQFIIVNARDRQAMVMGADGMGAGLGALTNNALVKMTMRDPRFSYEDLGAGERILGLPTRHVRVRNASTVEVRVFGRTDRSSESSVTETWIAARPAGLDAAAVQGWSHAFGAGLRRTNAELAAQMADYERQYGDGIALRSVGVSQSTDGKGVARTDTVRMEVTDLTRGRIDPAVFAVPAGYQTVDLGQVATAIDSARRARGDTGSLGDAMKKAANESIKDNATASVKGAIGGMFRRRRP